MMMMMTRLVLSFVLNPIFFYSTIIQKIEIQTRNKKTFYFVSEVHLTLAIKTLEFFLFVSFQFCSFSFSSSSLTEKQSNGSVHFDQQNISAVNKMSSKIRNLCICRRCCSVCYLGVDVVVCVYLLHVFVCMYVSMPVHVSHVYISI